jgi:cysteine synthase
VLGCADKDTTAISRGAKRRTEHAQIICLGGTRSKNNLVAVCANRLGDHADLAPANRCLIEAFGGQIDLVTDKDEGGGYLHTRIRRVDELVRTIPGAVWLNQYANPDNWRAHYHGIGEEIVREMPVEPTHVVAAVSTCGTLMGLARRLRERWPKIEVVAVDLEGSVIFGGQGGNRQIPGIGASRVPEQLARPEVDAVIYATDWESTLACRRLAESQGILAGGSSGTVMAAITKLIPNLGKG